MRARLPAYLLGLSLLGSASAGASPQDSDERVVTEWLRSVTQRELSTRDLEQLKPRLMALPASKSGVDLRLRATQVLGNSLAGREPGWIESVDGLFADTLPVTEGVQRLQAHHNYALFLLRAEQPAKALAMLDAVSADFSGAASAAIDPLVRASYHYHRGLALSALGRGPAALGELEKARQARPGFQAAREQTEKVAVATPGGAAALARLLAELVKGAELEPARALVERVLADEASVQRGFTRELFLPFARLLAADEGIELGLPRYEVMLERFARDEGLAQSAHELHVALSADVGLDASTRRLFSRWLDPEASVVLQQLLVNLGRAAALREDQTLALTRSWHAWQIRLEGLDAALQFVNLVRANPGNERARELLEEQIDRLFGAKGDAYLGKDRTLIVRFHALLGAVYESLGVWGSEMQVRSAVFQWFHAVRNLEGLPEGALPIAVPALHEHLGLAYERSGNPDPAWRSYLEAADGYLKLDDPEAAREMLVRCDRLPARPGPAERERKTDLQRRVGD